MSGDPMLAGNQSGGRDDKSPAMRGPVQDLPQRLDQAWRVLNLHQDLIRSADQKIYLLIVMSTLLVTFVSTNLEKIIRLGAFQKSVLVLFLVAAAAFFFLALSTVLARSRKAAARTPGIPHVVFFGDIASRANGAQYAESFCSAELGALLEDVCNQVYELAHVVNNKYRAYRRAWTALLIEVTLFLLLQFSIAL